nr:reverse transcriptase domain-containing protein [Tanacetum cinerariifolium]
MEELLQAPTEGYGEAIVILEINADRFEIKTNLLQLNDQDSLNVAAGGNILSKTTREALQIIKNKSKFRYSRSKLNVSRMNTNSRENASKTDDMIDKLADQISTLIDIVSKKVFTPATVKAVEESCVTYGGNHAYYNCDATNSNQSSVCVTTDALLLIPKFASTIKSFPANKDKLFELDKIPLNENCSAMLLKKLLKKLGDPGKFFIPWRPFLRTSRALIDVYGEEITIRVINEAVTFNLNQTTRYSSTYDDMSVNRIDVIDVARRTGIPEADTPPQNRPLLVTPRPRALEARIAVLETHAHRLEWQRQAANDFAVQHIMRTQALETGARDDTLEDTGSSS